MKLSFFTLQLLAIANLSFAQGPNFDDSSSKNTIFFEVLGTGLLYSFNYDRLLHSSQKFGISARAGFNIIPKIEGFHAAPTLGIPVEISTLLGKKKHKLELGLGSSYNYINDEDEISSLFALVPRIGYRLQKNEGGFFLKTGFTPAFPIFLNFDGEYEGTQVVPLIGFAIGHTFKK